MRHPQSILSNHIAEELETRGLSKSAVRTVWLRRCMRAGRPSGGVVLTCVIPGTFKHGTYRDSRRSTRLSAGYSRARFLGAVAGLVRWSIIQRRLLAYREGLYKMLDGQPQEKLNRIERIARKLGRPTVYSDMTAVDCEAIKRVAEHVLGALPSLRPRL